MVKFFALFPFYPFRLRNRNCHTYFSSSSLFLGSPPLTVHSSFILSLSPWVLLSLPNLLLPFCSSLTTLGSPSDPHTLWCSSRLTQVYSFCNSYCSPSGRVGGVWVTRKVSPGVQPLIAWAPWGASVRMLWLVKGQLFCPEEVPWWPLNCRGNGRVPPSLTSSPVLIACEAGSPLPHTNPEHLVLIGPGVVSHSGLSALWPLPQPLPSLFFREQIMSPRECPRLSPQGHLLVLLLVSVLTNCP